MYLFSPIIYYLNFDFNKKGAFISGFFQAFLNSVFTCNFSFEYFTVGFLALTERGLLYFAAFAIVSVFVAPQEPEAGA